MHIWAGPRPQPACPSGGIIINGPVTHAARDRPACLADVVGLLSLPMDQGYPRAIHSGGWEHRVGGVVAQHWLPCYTLFRRRLVRTTAVLFYAAFLFLPVSGGYYLYSGSKHREQSAYKSLPSLVNSTGYRVLLHEYLNNTGSADFLDHGEWDRS